MKIYIVIKTSFEAIHCWPDCPYESVSFLRNKHRHVFHVIMKWAVSHQDRDKEFIIVKRKVQEYINKHWSGQDLGKKSCEMMATELLTNFNAQFASVFEDDENGAEVYG